MNGFSDFVHQLLRAVLRLVLITAAAVFVFSLLIATLLLMLGASLWALLGGRRPEPGWLLHRFRQTASRHARGAWPARAGRAPPDIVDVTARDVPATPSSPEAADRTTPVSRDPMARMLR